MTVVFSDDGRARPLALARHFSSAPKGEKAISPACDPLDGHQPANQSDTVDVKKYGRVRTIVCWESMS